MQDCVVCCILCSVLQTSNLHPVDHKGLIFFWHDGVFARKFNGITHIVLNFLHEGVHRSHDLSI